jgi:hypothetical protein
VGAFTPPNLKLEYRTSARDYLLKSHNVEFMMIVLMGALLRVSYSDKNFSSSSVKALEWQQALLPTDPLAIPQNVHIQTSGFKIFRFKTSKYPIGTGTGYQTSKYKTSRVQNVQGSNRPGFKTSRLQHV